MRNRTVFNRHRPSGTQREWSKIVRFNGRDYPMNAVYDRDPGMDLDDAAYNSEHELDPSPEDLETGIALDELPWIRSYARRHRPFRIDESFFDDFAEEIFAEQNQKTQAQILAERAPYPMTDEQGNDFDVRMSDDTIKNSIFHLIANIVIVENCNGFDSIDDFLVTGGKMNEINTYKMMISGLAYRNGQFYYVAVPVKTGGSKYLQIYFTTEKDAIFRLNCPDVSLHRPKDQLVLNYERFCDINTINSNIGTKKDAEEYIRAMLPDYLRQAV